MGNPPGGVIACRPSEAAADERGKCRVGWCHLLKVGCVAHHLPVLDKINAGMLAGLTARVPGLLAGGQADGIAFLDVDDTVRPCGGPCRRS